MTTSRSKVPASAVSSLAALPAEASPIRLSDAALILLGQAAERPDGMLLPPPAALRARGGALRKVLQSLLKGALVAEVPVAEAAQGWRQGEGGGHFGLAITPEGFDAIGLPKPAPEPHLLSVPTPADAAVPGVADGQADSRTALPASTAAAAAEPKRDTKQARLVSLLSADGGRSVPALAAALAWQNHTVRAALTGLRQKGHELVKRKDAEGATVYRIEAAAPHAASAAAAPGA